MKISSELLLNFLLNACWQIALLTALAAFGSRLLRNSGARYHHWLWVSALCLAFLVPAITSSRVWWNAPQAIASADTAFAQDRVPFLFNETPPNLSLSTSTSYSVAVPPTLGWALLTLFCAFLLYRVFKLAQAWLTTRSIRRAALELEPDERIAAIIHNCERALGARSRVVRLMRSETLPVPVTVGLFYPAIILPESLLREGNSDLLTSAIGHEFIHVARHDYLLNFIYELIFVPLSFHPAAALLRRRVKQTRELCCDELVAERILNAEIYARSLVRLASSAPALRSLSVTTTVGIADADILEARIMSLLKKPELKTRWKKLWLVAVSLLLLVPSIAAAAFAMRFEVEQEPQEREVQESDRKEKVEMRLRESQSADAMKERTADEAESRITMQRRQEMEIEMKAMAQAAMVRLAKINMDQAIQVASSQQPGKVLLCSLGAKGWEEPGKLGKDGVVFYHVIIADEAGEGTSHVFINALDGSVMKTEKELPRKKRSSDNP